MQQQDQQVELVWVMVRGIPRMLPSKILHGNRYFKYHNCWVIGAGLPTPPSSSSPTPLPSLSPTPPISPTTTISG